MIPRAPVFPPQRITYVCPYCEAKRQATVSHYDIVTCGNCGEENWALQPRRGGPLVMFPHPSNYPWIH